MTRSLLRPALLSLAALGALALASRAQDDPKPDAPKDAPREAAEAPAAAEPAAEPRDFTGRYLANGQSNGGRAYKALVEITREGDVYQVVWVMGPNEGYMGVGIAQDESLAVGWSIGEIPGVVIYKRDLAPDSKKIVGRWTAPGSKGKTYTETLTPVG